MVQIESHHRISRLQKGLINRNIGACPRMRLYTGMFASKQLFCTLDCQIFNHIYIFTASVIPFPRISFRILVCRDRPHRKHHRRAYYIFRCDQLQISSLPSKFLFQSPADFRIVLFDVVRNISYHTHTYFLLKSIFLLFLSIRIPAENPGQQKKQIK